MEVTVKKGHYKFVTKEHLVYSPKRSQEVILSVIAYDELRNPSYDVRYETDGSRYLQFKKSWRRCRLRYDFFQTNEIIYPENEDEFIHRRVYPILSLITGVLTSIKIDPTLYFSPISFWTFVYDAYARGVSLRKVDVERCFSLTEYDDELKPILDDYTHNLPTKQFGKYRGVLLPTEVSRYYFNAIHLANVDDFRVINQRSSKQVLWLRDQFVTINDIVSELENINSYSFSFHVDQNLDRMHLFYYVNDDELTRSMYFEIYRYWRDSVKLYSDTSSKLKRSTYCMGSLRSDQKSLMLGLMSVLTPLKEFDVFKFKNFDLFRALVDRWIFMYEQDVWFGNHTLLRPFRAIYQNFDVIPYEFTPVWLSNVSISLDGSGLPEPRYTKFRISSLPNPDRPIETVKLGDATGVLSFVKKREFSVDSLNLFQARAFDLSGPCAITLLKNIGSLTTYRSQWYDIRGQTKDLYIDGNDIDGRNIYKKYQKWNDPNARMSKLVKNVLSVQNKMHVNDRVQWNKSTQKLLAVLNKFDLEYAIDQNLETSILFCGVIKEPIVHMLHQSDYKFKAHGIGDQAGIEFERSNLKNAIFGGRPYIIISDIDQASAIDELGVSKKIVDVINWCLNLDPRFLIVKCQYTMIGVLTQIMKSLSCKNFKKVELWKILNSGPLGLESFLFFDCHKDGKIHFSLGDAITGAYLKQVSCLAQDKPHVVDNPIIVSPAEPIGYVNYWDYKRMVIFANRINTNRLYKRTISAMLSISDKVNLVPHGNIEFPGYLAYAFANEARCLLSSRGKHLGLIEDDQYNMLPRTFESVAIDNIKQLNLARYLPPDRVFNLLCKEIVRKKLLDHSFVEDRNVLYDIGGRKLEGILYCPEYMHYNVIDKINVPEFIDAYDVKLYNEYIDWKKIPPYMKTNSVVVMMFVIMSDLLTHDQLIERISFVSMLKEKGFKVIFNCYMSPRGEYSKTIRDVGAIKLNDDLTKGTFGDYELVPLLNYGSLPKFDELKIEISDVVETCYKHGIALSSELMTYLDVFSQFCPVMC